MNTRSKSKTKRREEKKWKQEIMEKVVKKINFDEDSENTPHQYQSQHEFVVALETIPNLKETHSYQSTNQTTTTINANTNTGISCSSQQNESYQDSIREITKESSRESEGKESFISAKEFFADATTRDRLTSDYYSGTDTPSKLRESTRRLSLSKPLNSYIAYSSDEELEDWWDQPKTDYTYSASLTYRDRVTPERRIGSPNMSRRGLRGSGTATVTTPPFHNHLPLDTPDSLALRSRQVPKVPSGAAGLYSDESDAEEEALERVSHSRESSVQYKGPAVSNRRTRGSRIVSSVSSTSSVVSYGLDVNSDAEECDSPPFKFARPVVRRGYASLFKSLGDSQTCSSSTMNYLNGSDRTDVGNHVSHSSLTTTTASSFWEKLNGKTTYTLNQNDAEEDGGKSRRWKDKLYDWQCHSREKITQTFITIYTSILLWSTYLSEGVRRRWLHRKQKSHGLDGQQWKKTSVTVTTTTVMSRKRKVVSFFEKIVTWHKGKRKERPFLWLWLPLFVFLLIPLIAWLSFREDTDLRGISPSSGSIWKAVSADKLNAFFTQLSSFTHSIFSLFTQSALKVTEFAVSMFYWFLEFLKSIIFICVNSIHFIWIWTINCSSSVLSFFSTSTRAPAYVTTDGESTTTESHWISYYSPLPILSRSWQSIGKYLNNAYGLCWVSVASTFEYVGTSLHVLGLSLLSIGQSLSYAISYLLSSLWFLACYTFECIMSAVWGLVGLPLKFWSWVVLFAEKSKTVPAPEQVTQAPPPPSPSAAFVGLNSEELVEQVLKSPRLLTLIYDALDDRAVSRESLSAAVKENIQFESNKIKSEIVEQESSTKQEFSFAKQDIQSLRSRQELLTNQFRDMSITLGDMLSRQEADARNEALTDQMQAKLSVISDNLEKVSQDLGSLQNSHIDLTAEVRACCKNSSFTLEDVKKVVTTLLSDFIGLSPDGDAKGVLSSTFGMWLTSYFATKESVATELVGLQKKLSERLQEASSVSEDARSDALQQTADLVMDTVLKRIKQEIKVEIQTQKSELQVEVGKDTTATVQGMPQAVVNATVERIVREALLKYDADKTGMVDHALESGGGSIVSTRCTEGYQGHQAELTLFGYSFYRYSTNTPRSIIQPDRNPGQCYAFKGSQGYIVIQFAGPVKVTGFTMEHIPKVLTPSGTIDSAPRDFSVYGLRTLQMTEEEGYHFGDFSYSADEGPLQYYDALNVSEEYFPYVELRIHSNHGNMQYTCIYRFRVHGVREF